MARRLFLLCALSLLWTPGCDTGVVSDPDSGAPSPCLPNAPGLFCEGDTAYQCLEDGSEAFRSDCTATGEVCVPGLGCRVCPPGRFRCVDNDVEQCNVEGGAWEPRATCDGSIGEVCNGVAGICQNPCADAAATNSYIGCEYWPTISDNNSLATEFEFAIVVSNPDPVLGAEVSVTRGGTEVATLSLPAGALDTIRLPWVDELKGSRINLTDPYYSALVPSGAYRVTSSIPLTVYQFNPLEYRLDMDCANETGSDGQCFSFSNDASLLLPTHVLTENYLAVARPTRTRHYIVRRNTTIVAEGYTQIPGFVAITAVAAGTTSIDVTSSAFTAASSDGTISAMSPGDTQTFDLQQGDVLQLLSAPAPTPCPAGSPADPAVTIVCGTRPNGQPLYCTQVDEYCNVPPEYDLTGTQIRATQPVMVLGGHECAFVPHYTWACDHLEETIFPLEAWGKDFVVSITEPLRSEPNLIRIVSGHDVNSITFEPASVHDPVTLGLGEMIEFETSEDFRVVGSEALIVAQFLVGQDYAGRGTSGDMAVGDPSMSFAIPSEQFRNQYNFLAPLTYERNFVNVTAPVGVDVSLSSNGGAAAPIGGWRTVGTTGMQTARVEIPGGSHTMTSALPFGIVVYGFGSYTSYMYPGGLDLEPINIPF